MWSTKPETLARLTDEPMGWLTTVSGDGVPSTAPVWFYLEDDDRITIFSKDPSRRVDNLAENSNVTLHLEGDGRGGDIAVLNGTATIDESIGQAADHPRFIAKYQGFLDRYGWTAEWFSDHYPTPISLTIRSIRGR